jgi:leishmanolysin-like peptidase
MAGSWLHKGAIVCPDCAEMCGDEFRLEGHVCKKSKESPLPNYPRDELTCSGTQNLVNFTLVTLMLISLLVPKR